MEKLQKMFERIEERYNNTSKVREYFYKILDAINEQIATFMDPHDSFVSVYRCDSIIYRDDPVIDVYMGIVAPLGFGLYGRRDDFIYELIDGDNITHINWKKFISDFEATIEKIAAISDHEKALEYFKDLYGKMKRK